MAMRQATWQSCDTHSLSYNPITLESKRLGCRPMLWEKRVLVLEALNFLLRIETCYAINPRLFQKCDLFIKLQHSGSDNVRLVIQNTINNIVFLIVNSLL